MVLQQVAPDRLENETLFLRFEDAVSLSRELESFFNSPQSDSVIVELAEKFKLGIKKDFTVFVPVIEKNCKECMGCHSGGCILGCFITEPGAAEKVCFWDEAIEAAIGTKLVVHEYGHVIFEQIFTNELNEEAAFEKSEEFAQFLEANFTIIPGGCNNCSQEPFSEFVPGNQENSKMDDVFDTLGNAPNQLIESLIVGIGFALGSAGFALIINQFGKGAPSTAEDLTDNNPLTN